MTMERHRCPKFLLVVLKKHGLGCCLFLQQVLMIDGTPNRLHFSQKDSVGKIHLLNVTTHYFSWAIFNSKLLDYQMVQHNLSPKTLKIR